MAKVRVPMQIDRWMIRSSVVGVATLLFLACSSASESASNDVASTSDAGSDSPDTDGGSLVDGASRADASTPAVCGDGLCALTENTVTCCKDCGICDDQGRVDAKTGVVGGVVGPGITPGGMTDTHANFAGGPVADVVYPLMVTKEPIATARYFWAQQFFFTETTQGGYLGIQTNGNVGTRVVPKSFIFSIWDSPAATPLPGATCQPFGGEGVGQSCRLPFDWRENVVYRFELKEQSADHWVVTVHDPTSGNDLGIGVIETPAAWGLVKPATAGFTEYFTDVPACTSIPYAEATFHSPRAGGMAPTSVAASTYGTCVGQASVTCTGTWCTK